MVKMDYTVVKINLREESESDQRLPKISLDFYSRLQNKNESMSSFDDTKLESFIFDLSRIPKKEFAIFLQRLKVNESCSITVNYPTHTDNVIFIGGGDGTVLFEKIQLKTRFSKVFNVLVKKELYSALSEIISIYNSFDTIWIEESDDIEEYYDVDEELLENEDFLTQKMKSSPKSAPSRLSFRNK